MPISMRTAVAARVLGGFYAHLQDIRDVVPVRLPAVPPEDPSVWVVTRTDTVLTMNGSFRVEYGQEFTDPAEVNQLVLAGAEIVPLR